jgi:hypothetical protein
MPLFTFFLFLPSNEKRHDHGSSQIIPTLHSQKQKQERRIKIEKDDGRKAQIGTMGFKTHKPQNKNHRHTPHHNDGGGHHSLVSKNHKYSISANDTHVEVATLASANDARVLLGRVAIRNYADAYAEGLILKMSSVAEAQDSIVTETQEEPKHKLPQNTSPRDIRGNEEALNGGTIPAATSYAAPFFNWWQVLWMGTQNATNDCTTETNDCITEMSLSVADGTEKTCNAAQAKYTQNATNDCITKMCLSVADGTEKTYNAALAKYYTYCGDCSADNETDFSDDTFQTGIDERAYGSTSIGSDTQLATSISSGHTNASEDTNKEDAPTLLSRDKQEKSHSVKVRTQVASSDDEEGSLAAFLLLQEQTEKEKSGTPKGTTATTTSVLRKASEKSRKSNHLDTSCTPFSKADELGDLLQGLQYECAAQNSECIGAQKDDVAPNDGSHHPHLRYGLPNNKLMRRQQARDGVDETNNTDSFQVSNVCITNNACVTQTGSSTQFIETSSGGSSLTYSQAITDDEVSRLTLELARWQAGGLGASDSASFNTREEQQQGDELVRGSTTRKVDALEFARMQRELSSLRADLRAALNHTSRYGPTTTTGGTKDITTTSQGQTTQEKEQHRHAFGMHHKNTSRALSPFKKSVFTKKKDHHHHQHHQE